MDPTIFDDCLDRYGADLGAWPEDLRAAAHAFIATSETARRAWQLMDEIESALRADRPSVTSIDLIAARAVRFRQDRPVHRIVRRSASAAAAAVVLALGFILGGAESSHETGSDRTLIAAFEQVGVMDVD